MIFLLPFSYVFWLVVWLRNRCYDRGIFRAYRLPGRVVSIGNIALGGTGKSPLVTAIAARALHEGHSVVILSRGYRSGLRNSEWQVYLDGKVVLGDRREDCVADEARMQSIALRGVYVVVGVKRAQAARNFLQHFHDKSFDFWVLDDGFQHRQIHRDRDVVLLDARCPFGPLIPAGLFREPISALRRAHEIMITKADTKSQVTDLLAKLRSLNIAAPIKVIEFYPQNLTLAHGALITPANYGNTRWCAVAGIARPEDFLKFLKQMGITPTEFIRLGDHQTIDFVEIGKILDRVDGIVTTTKDWARDQETYRKLTVPVFVLEIGMRERDSEEYMLLT